MICFSLDLSTPELGSLDLSSANELSILTNYGLTDFEDNLAASLEAASTTR